MSKVVNETKLDTSPVIDLDRDRAGTVALNKNGDHIPTSGNEAGVTSSNHSSL